jgi:hypothetical protein
MHDRPGAATESVSVHHALPLDSSLQAQKKAAHTFGDQEDSMLA